MPSAAALYGGVALGEEDDLADIGQVERASPFIELGSTGLKRAAGYVDEEFIPQLRGRKAVQIYREMSENEPMVGAMLLAVRELIGNIDWGVTPAGKSREYSNGAKLVETAMDDMSHSWKSMIDEVLSCIIYGWSWHEVVYKRCMGPWERDGRKRSKYSDGLIRWRKIPIRSQDTLMRWSFDPSGDVRAMVQLAPPYYQTRTLPISRSLLFRPWAHKNNPEGVSMLRTAYRPWFFLKRLQEIEAIGVERDLAGLPKADIPAEYLKARPGSEQYKMVESIKKMSRSVRRNEQEGIIFPRAYDPDTKQSLFEFSLLGSGGARQFSTDTLIQRYETRILMTMLADFIMVGHQSTGTYNMHVDKTGIFKTALNSIAGMIADIFNRHAIPRLFAINGWRPDALPRIEPSDVEAPDLTQLAQFLGATAGLGFSWGPDADMERWLRSVAGMPQLMEQDYESHRREARVEEATRYAEVQTRYLAARSALAQGQAEQRMQAAGYPPMDQMQAQMQQHDATAQQQGQDQQAQQQGAIDNRRAEEQHQLALMQAGSPGGGRPPARPGAARSNRGSPRASSGGGRNAAARR